MKMRRFLFTLLIALLVVCLVTLVQTRQTATNLTSEIEPTLYFTVGNSKVVTSKCQRRVPKVILPKSSLTASELAVIVNDEDPQSIAVANYYQRRRNIPRKNIVHISMKPILNEIDPSTFQFIKSQIDTELEPNIQAIALSFSRPFKVGCMSITSAFTLGYDDQFCQQKVNVCRFPKLVSYYNSNSVKPFTDLGIRPSIMLAGENKAQVFDLINKGVLSDKTFPRSVEYLLTTTDRARSTRSPQFSALANIWDSNSGWTIESLNNADGKIRSDFISKKHDILFYLTGLTNVPAIETNTYLPGAIADHLTSLGGVLFGSSQMSILNWIKAGVTGSYGTVVEPCNFPAKFPNAAALITNYYKGQTLLEAYWKSVASPQEGVFVGEPLAKPMGVKVTPKKDHLSLKLSILDPGKTYQVYGADSQDGIYSPVSDLINVPNYQTVEMNFYCDHPYYKLVEVTENNNFYN